MTASHPAELPITKVLVVGGSYGGLSAAVNLLDINNHTTPRFNYPNYTWDAEAPRTPIEVTLVDERDGFYHLIGSPLAFASSSYSEHSWTRYADIPAVQHPNLHIVHGSVSSVDTAAKEARIVDVATKQERVQSYDYLIAASGLRRPFPVQPQAQTRKAFLLEAGEHIHSVENATDGVVVVGGGAVGIEMAAELRLVHPDVKVTLIHSRNQLLSNEPLCDELKDRCLELTREMGVEVLLNKRVKETRIEVKDGVKKKEVELTDGTKLMASEVIVALSKSVPSSSFFPSSALDEEGYVKITPRLTLEEGTPNADFHFVAGDVARWSGIKRCGGAMHMGYHSAINVHQSILSRALPGREPAWLEISEFLPRIGLAVGKKAVAVTPGGPVIHGEDVMEAYFGNNLGLATCWDYMQLSPEKMKDRLAA